MRARLAVGIAAVLAVVILLPVAVVIALGAYGSSLGGATVATGPGNAELLVFPSHGLPGSSLKVTGKHWPPRSNVAIQLQRPSAGSDSPSKPLRLAEIITSRRGTFEIDTTIPGSVIPFGTESVRIQAVGRKSSQPDAAVLSVPFDLDPYPNEVTISVVDADTGAASPEAIVRIDDSFGQRIAVDTSGETGDVLFAGIRPGKKRLTVRKVDYEIAQASIEVPDAGQASFRIDLRKSPGRRLLFYAYGLSDSGETTLVGLDRASGLPVRERITVPDGRFAPASVPSWNLYQGFFLAVDEDSGAISARAGDMDSLWALGAVGQWMLSIRQGMWVGIWHSYLGRSTIGDVVDSRASNQLSAPGSHLYIVDPDSGQIVFRRRVARYFLPPVLSPTESRLYLVNWAGRSVDSLDLLTREQSTIPGRLPTTVIGAIVDPVDDTNLILSGVDGSVYKLQTTTGEVSEVFRSSDVQAIVAVTNDGKLITSAFRSRELVVSSLETGQIEAVIPLHSHMDSILVDRSGPFIFGATLDWPNNAIMVQVIDTDTLTLVDVLDIPRAERTGGSQLPPSG